MPKPITIETPMATVPTATVEIATTVPMATALQTATAATYNATTA